MNRLFFRLKISMKLPCSKVLLFARLFQHHTNSHAYVFFGSKSVPSIFGGIPLDYQNINSSITHQVTLFVSNLTNTATGSKWEWRLDFQYVESNKGIRAYLRHRLLANHLPHAIHNYEKTQQTGISNHLNVFIWPVPCIIKAFALFLGIQPKRSPSSMFLMSNTAAANKTYVFHSSQRNASSRIRGTFIRFILGNFPRLSRFYNMEITVEGHYIHRKTFLSEGVRQGVCDTSALKLVLLSYKFQSSAYLHQIS